MVPNPSNFNDIVYRQSISIFKHFFLALFLIANRINMQFTTKYNIKYLKRIRLDLCVLSKQTDFIILLFFRK